MFCHCVRAASRREERSNPSLCDCFVVPPRNDILRFFWLTYLSVGATEFITNEKLERSIHRTQSITALPAAMRYILKAESYDRKGQEEKLYCIIAGSAVK
jgi:hypothetical protein